MSDVSDLISKIEALGMMIFGQFEIGRVNVKVHHLFLRIFSLQISIKPNGL